MTLKQFRDVLLKAKATQEDCNAYLDILIKANRRNGQLYVLRIPVEYQHITEALADHNQGYNIRKEGRETVIGQENRAGLIARFQQIKEGGLKSRMTFPDLSWMNPYAWLPTTRWIVGSCMGIPTLIYVVLKMFGVL